MSLPPKPKSRPITGRQKAACVVFTLTCPVLATDYWQNGGSITFFGSVPLPVLFLVASLGGAVSFLLWAAGHLRRIAAIPGAIAGFGAFGLHFLYTNWLEKETLQSGESVMIALIGALPGMLMLWGLSKVFKADETVPRDIAEKV